MIKLRNRRLKAAEPKLVTTGSTVNGQATISTQSENAKKTNRPTIDTVESQPSEQTALLSKANQRSNTGTSTGNATVERDPNGVNLWFVLSMTIAGAADEIMCFPPLLLGNTFSLLELSAGCLAACVSLIVILLSFYAMFRPVFEVLDRIPLYAVVTLLAVIQTVDIMYELT